MMLEKTRFKFTLKRRSWLLSVLSLLFSSGCSMFTPPLENPLITDYQKNDFHNGKREFGSSSLTASRRMILFKFKDGDGVSKGGNNVSTICAEPPPTVGDELSKVLQTAVSATVNVAEDKGEGNASVYRSLNAT